ncbi:hypothetical protein S83_059601 [Arachis hypogaea]
MTSASLSSCSIRRRRRRIQLRGRWFLRARLRLNPNKEHKADEYEDLQLMYCPTVFTALERYLPPNMLNARRTQVNFQLRLAFQLRLLWSRSSNTQRFISSRFASCRKSYMTMFGILVMHDLTAASQGSSEPEAKWFDLFSSRYRKVVSVGAALFLLQQFATSMEDLEPYDCSNTPYDMNTFQMVLNILRDS